MEESINDRIKRVIEYLSVSENKFSVAIGIRQSVINSMFKRGTEPSAKIIKAIINAYPSISLDWLITGNGQMINQQTEQTPIKNEVTQITTGGVMMVPLVNQYAHAGYMTGYADAVYVESLPKIPWIVDHEYKGKYVSFEVRGDSMDDGMKHSYEQGDILLGREIYQEYWKCKLHINTWDAFIIVHKTDGIVVKQIIDHDVENGVITCHSFNPLYPDFKIDLREVAQLFNVVKQQKNK